MLTISLTDLLARVDAGAEGEALDRYEFLATRLSREELRAQIAARREQAADAVADFAAEYQLSDENQLQLYAPESPAFTAAFKERWLEDYRRLVESVPLMASAQKQLARAAFESWS